MKIIFKRKINNKSKTPDEQYEEYIEKHVNGVKKVYYDILRPVLVNENVSESILSKIDFNINNHDKSKYDQEEWSAYRNYFYDREKYPRSSEAFSYAWNHHQKLNPHHWQFWCLLQDSDDPPILALEMPLEYVVEMVCDWQSAGEFYGNTAYTWYQQQKDRMILHSNTRVLVEKYIEYLK